MSTKEIPVTFAQGRGMATYTLQQVYREFEEKFSIKLHPGSYNVLSTKPDFLLKEKAFYISEDNHRYFWKARLNGLDVFIYRWRTCPAHVYEIVSATHLNKKFNQDDELSLEYSDTYSCKHFKRKLVWYTLWKFREKLFYKNCRYTNMVLNINKLRYLYNCSGGIYYKKGAYSFEYS